MLMLSAATRFTSDLLDVRGGLKHIASRIDEQAVELRALVPSNRKPDLLDWNLGTFRLSMSG